MTLESNFKVNAKILKICPKTHYIFIFSWMVLCSTKQLPLVSRLQRSLQIVDKTEEFKVHNNVLLLKVLMKMVNISHNDCMWRVYDKYDNNLFGSPK